MIFYVIRVYYSMFGIENEVCSTYDSFTRAIKRIPLHFGLFYVVKLPAIYFNYITLF